MVRGVDQGIHCATGSKAPNERIRLPGFCAMWRWQSADPSYILIVRSSYGHIECNVVVSLGGIVLVAARTCFPLYRRGVKVSLDPPLTPARFGVSGVVSSISCPHGKESCAASRSPGAPLPTTSSVLLPYCRSRPSNVPFRDIQSPNSLHEGIHSADRAGFVNHQPERSMII